MLCPVCKTECGSISLCHECGFSEVGKIFVNQEEANHWVESVVAPYRDSYNKENILQPIDWIEVLKQNHQVRHLLDISIPVSIKKRTNIEVLADSQDLNYNTYISDTILEPTAFISPNELVRKQFINILNDRYRNIATVRSIVSKHIEQTGDLAILLSKLSPGDVLIFEVNSILNSNMTALMVQAIREFSMEIQFGKGSAAQSIVLDLPGFTPIIVADSRSTIPNEIISTLSTVIELNLSDSELIELQIREAAVSHGIQLTKTNIGVIKEMVTHKPTEKVNSLLRLISDYLYLHTEIHQPVSKDTMYEIINQLI